MKILLIHPPAYKNINVVRQGRCTPSAIPNIRMEFPIFLAYVAAVLREADHSVAVIDAMAENLSLASIKKRIAGFAPDAVIVETVPITFWGDKFIAHIAKRIDPQIRIVYYGWHATARPEDLLASQDIDFVVRGEPEYTFLELINTLDNGADLSNVKGLSFKENNIVRHNQSRPFTRDLDQLPYPARDLFRVEKYVAEPLGRVTTVVSGRGCPYSCIFCASNLMDGSIPRSRCPRKVAGEITSVVHRFKIRNIFFYADTFTLWNDKNITQFCREILERKLDIRWLINSRVDTLPSENTLKYMAKSGCFLIQFGVESGSLEMLKAMKKGKNIQECRAYLKTVTPAIKKTKKMGIFTKVNMIVGFLGENEETVRRSVNLLKECKPDLPVHFDFVRAYPGTVLAEIAEQRGLLPPSKRKGFSHACNFRKISLELYAKINNCSSARILELQKAANEAVRLTPTKKLRLALKLLRKGEFGIFLSIFRLAVKENVHIRSLSRAYGF